MNYNILCNKMATQSLYGYVPSWALQWEYRRAIIREQLLESKADIICLQEVDLENFNSFFIPELGLAGYKGQIQPKSRANTMTESERKVVDGCATFYNSEKWVHSDLFTEQPV
jgi:CCR4-NOT transcription complex subunit 6